MAKKPTQEEIVSARMDAAADAFGDYRNAKRLIEWLADNGYLTDKAGSPADLAFAYALAYAPDKIKEAFVLLGGEVPAPRKSGTTDRA